MGGGGLTAVPSMHSAAAACVHSIPETNPFHSSSAPIPPRQQASPIRSSPPSPRTSTHGSKTYTLEEIWLNGRERLRPVAKPCAVRINDQQCDAELATDLLYARVSPKHQPDVAVPSLTKQHLQKHLEKIETSVVSRPYCLVNGMQEGNPHAPRPQVWIGSQRMKWDNIQELHHAFDGHAFRSCLCAVEGESLAESELSA